MCRSTRVYFRHLSGLNVYSRGRGRTAFSPMHSIRSCLWLNVILRTFLVSGFARLFSTPMRSSPPTESTPAKSVGCVSTFFFHSYSHNRPHHKTNSSRRGNRRSCSAQTVCQPFAATLFNESSYWGTEGRLENLVILYRPDTITQMNHNHIPKRTCLEEIPDKDALRRLFISPLQQTPSVNITIERRNVETRMGSLCKDDLYILSFYISPGYNESVAL